MKDSFQFGRCRLTISSAHTDMTLLIRRAVRLAAAAYRSKVRHGAPRWAGCDEAIVTIRQFQLH